MSCFILKFCLAFFLSLTFPTCQSPLSRCLSRPWLFSAVFPFTSVFFSLCLPRSLLVHCDSFVLSLYSRKNIGMGKMCIKGLKLFDLAPRGSVYGFSLQALLKTYLKNDRGNAQVHLTSCSATSRFVNLFLVSRYFP